MGTIVDYVKKYKDKNFYEEEFNEIDNLILCMINYVDFSGIIPEDRNYITLNDAILEYLRNNTEKDTFKNKGIASKEGYKLLNLIKNTTRFKDILVYNYIYESDINKQFGAITYKIKKDLIYVCFEGTDNLLSGWKEDFQLAYKYPIPSQKIGIEYLNKTISIFDKNVIVGGHSKGGNVALVASMESNFFKRRKIKKIYSNDGPGLRKIELDSYKYKRIKEKYIHLVPNYSYVGVLLRNDKYDIIKTKRKDIMGHSVLNWELEDKKLIRTKLSTVSSNLEKSILLWLDKHDFIEREKMIENVFKALEDSNIKRTIDIINIKNLTTIIKKINNIDDETKKLVLDFIKFNLSYLIRNNKSDK